MSETTGRWASAAMAGSQRIEAVPFGVLAVFVALLNLIRVGFEYQTPVGPGLPIDIDAIPWSRTVLNPAVLAIRVLHTSTRPQLVVAALVGYAIVVTVMAVVIARCQPRELTRWILVLILLGPIGTNLLVHLGRNDSVLLLGVVLVTLGGPRPWLWITGSALMVVANPGQSAIIAVAFLALMVIPALQHLLRPALVLAGLAILGLVGSAVLSGLTGVPTQAAVGPEQLADSLALFTASAPLLVASVYGLGWVVVIGAFIVFPQRYAWALAVSLLVIPILVMAVTLDGTRVGVGIGALPFLVVLPTVLAAGRERIPAQWRSPAFALLLVTAIIVPAVDVYLGSVRAPWS